MVASHDPEMARCVGEFTFFDVLYPGAKYADRHLVLLFTRDRAGVTANATVLVDDKSVSHLWAFILRPARLEKDFGFDIIADSRLRRRWLTESVEPSVIL